MIPWFQELAVICAIHVLSIFKMMSIKCGYATNLMNRDSASHSHMVVPCPRGQGGEAVFLGTFGISFKFPCSHWILTKSKENFLLCPKMVEFKLQRSDMTCIWSTRKRLEMQFTVWKGIPLHNQMDIHHMYYLKSSYIYVYINWFSNNSITFSKWEHKKTTQMTWAHICKY